jgi:hypothetical protein
VIEVPKKNLPLMRISPRNCALKKVAEKKKRSRSNSEPLTCKKKKCNLPSEDISLTDISTEIALD